MLLCQATLDMVEIMKQILYSFPFLLSYRYSYVTEIGYSFSISLLFHLYTVIYYVYTHRKF